MRAAEPLGQIPAYIGEDTVIAIGPRLPRIGQYDRRRQAEYGPPVIPFTADRPYAVYGDDRPPFYGRLAQYGYGFVPSVPQASAALFPQVSIPLMPSATPQIPMALPSDGASTTAWWQALPALTTSAAILTGAISQAVKAPPKPAPIIVQAPPGTPAGATPAYYVTAPPGAPGAAPLPAGAPAPAGAWYSSPYVWIGGGLVIFLVAIMATRR